MAQSLFSPSWYRVAQLTPRLRKHAHLHRHEYRGQTWYVLQDLTSERFHRFSPSAYLIIGQMDGQRTVHQIWETALAQLGDNAVTQDETIQLLSQLHAADVLQCDVPPDTAELFRRQERLAKSQLKRRLFSIFAWQIPLLDPDRLLLRTLPRLRPIFSVGGLLIWLAVVGAAIFLGTAHWRELTENMLDRVLMPENLVILWLLFPLLKLLHEFGHAYAVKAFGGEVHEMGIMILALTPVPYVDASAAWAFRSKGQRVLVGAAGMAVEVFVASLALFLWLNAEPGAVRALAYNTILIAGISTVMFNANPLLRFDGYYMLMDFIEIPNLRTRATTYLIFLCERYLFGRKDALAPIVSRGEKLWFVGFSVASFLYRLLVILAILLLLGQMSLLLGVIFAASTAFAWLVLPGLKIMNFLLTSPRIRRVRSRALLTSAGVIGALAVLLGVIPVPFRTVAEGVVWVPEEGLVRGGADGFIEAVLASPGSWVTAGTVLIQCRDPDLETEIRALKAQMQELAARHRAVLQDDRVKADIIAQQQRYVEEGLQRAQERQGDLAVRSRTAGFFVLPQAEDLVGRFVRKGQQIGHIIERDKMTVRTVISQQDIELVRGGGRDVEVRLIERRSRVDRAKVTRIVPAASDQLPSPALGSQGGGQLALDPSDKEGRKVVQRFFQVDVELPADERRVHVGGRAYIRFDLGWEPIGYQWYRNARQLFLSRLNV
jgi:putative peptide zinc metalloprotease protein